MKLEATKLCQHHDWENGEVPTSEESNATTKETWRCKCGFYGNYNQVSEHIYEEHKNGSCIDRIS